MKKIKIDKSKLGVSEDYNESAEGIKRSDTDVIIMEKPRKTWWFRAYGESLEDLTLCMSVAMKGADKMDADFLVYGSEEFKDRGREDFGGGKLFWPVLYRTVSGKCGIYNLTKPIMHFGQTNSWLQSALNVVELAQHKWVRMQSNQDANGYDCWQHIHQETLPQKEFSKTLEEAISQGWGDYILTAENYDDNSLVKDHLSGVKVDFSKQFKKKNDK